MKVTPQKLAEFKKIVETYKSNINIPKKHYWKELNNNYLWLHVVKQINVVGNVKGNDRFFNSPHLQKRISLRKLGKIKNDKKLQVIINSVLRDAGIRYSSKNSGKCRKSKALAYNYKAISEKGGLRAILNHISKFNGKNAELERVNYLTELFKYIKNKGARDFLMGLGINRNTIAIDIRIQTVFKHYGFDIPSSSDLSKKSIYDNIEKEIIEKICIPLNIEPIMFDRILFQKYSEIIGRCPDKKIFHKCISN